MEDIYTPGYDSLLKRKEAEFRRAKRTSGAPDSHSQRDTRAPMTFDPAPPPPALVPEHCIGTGVGGTALTAEALWRDGCCIFTASNASLREMAQEAKQTQTNPNPALCASGCGFYGNARTNGMCSVCNKDTLQRQNSKARASPPEWSGGGSIESESGPVPASPAATTLEQSSIISSQSAEEPDSQKDRTKEPQGSVLDHSDLPSVDGQRRSPDKINRKKNRCFTCHKKVGLTGFGCRCGNVFCGPHRYSDVHSCSFDYKTQGAEQIRKENPRVIGKKIHKI
ncbi:hypothetical protein AAFF_G00067540 [Aldrovandia affinis]|uniref:AN1-type zinc finger protein 6 n=1 Tax=Aldrovandia affinis TaxID=143900 RepID=A0AAD7WDF2_9TELE|nr:hypothetical protein AAFF_G00067540 [Aldrovandia affinis]